MYTQKYWAFPVHVCPEGPFLLDRAYKYMYIATDK